MKNGADQNKEFLNMSHARTGAQEKDMRKIQKDGVCPFCADYIKKYHKPPVLKENNSWFVTENMYPYSNAKIHLLFINKDHLIDTTELNSDSLNELLDLLNWSVSEYDIVGGTFLLRFGDTRFNGATVSHLHAQLVVGDADNPEHKPVKVVVG